MDPMDLYTAVEWLKKGEPIVMPTETVYGLAAPLFNIEAVQKIFTIKGRPLDNPLIAHIANLEQAHLLSDDLPPAFFKLAEHFWPGPLTLVVKRRPEVPELISAGQPTIAIRMPQHPLAQKLIELMGEPLVAPSANLSGRPSPTRFSDVWEDLEGKVKGGIDGGECEVGIESTVLSLFHPVPTLLRPGKITREMIEGVLNVRVALPPVDGPVLSPGMKYRHYAPKATLKIVYDRKSLEGPYILSPIRLANKATHRLSAKTFYAQLRQADRSGASQIEIYCPPSIQSDEALMNRLLRAAGQIS